MSPGFEALLQVAGVAAAVVSAWYAVKQYRLASASKRDESRIVDSGVQTFVCDRHPDQFEQIGALFLGGSGFLGLLWVVSAEVDDFEGVGYYVLFGAAFCSMMIGGSFVWQRAGAPFTVELSERHITVRQDYRQPRELRIAWNRVDHFADMYQDSKRRRLVAVPPKEHGYLPELPQERYSKYDGGYVLCDFKKVNPSKTAFREAVARYSGLEVW